MLLIMRFTIVCAYMQSRRQASSLMCNAGKCLSSCIVLLSNTQGVHPDGMASTADLSSQQIQREETQVWLGLEEVLSFLDSIHGHRQSLGIVAGGH